MYADSPRRNSATDPEYALNKEGGLLHKACAGVRSLDLPACVKDSQLRYVCVNKAYARFAGCREDEIVGRSTQAVFGNGDDREDKERRCLVFSTDEIATCKSACVTETHTLRCERFVDEAGQIYLFEVFETMPRFGSPASGITPSGHAGSLFDAAGLHGQFLDILQSLPVGVMLLGPDLTIEYVNRRFYELWELPDPPELAGLSYRHYLELGFNSGLYDVGECNFEKLYEDRLARFKSPEGLSAYEVESKSGTLILLSTTRLSGGRVLITLSDRSAIRSRDREIADAQEELQRLGTYMRDATGAMAQGLALIESGKFILANDAVARMFAVPPEMLSEGRNWTDAFQYCAARGDFGNDEEAAHILAEWTRYIGENRPFSVLIKVAGSTWLNIDVTLTSGAYWLVIATDMTEMKAREEELERLLARAEAADRAKSEFLATMSHEIRTPMNGVIGMAELLSRSSLDARQKTFTDVMVKSGNALLTIINDILDFSKMDAGQMALRNQPFDPREAVEDVASLLAPQAQAKSVDLLIDIDASVDSRVDGDVARFRQILTNLVGNAIKFTQKGHVLIRLAAETVDPSEILLKLVVEDTGIGIAKDKLDTIFEKFSQVDGSNTRRHEGTGLGLAITVGLVGLFGGKIDIDSELSRGSTLTVSLPLRKVESVDDTTAPAPDLQRPRVLIIDDSEVNREILTQQLTRWAMDAHAAENGSIGIAILKEACALGIRPDAVILDDRMTKGPGLDVAREIRSHAALGDIPIILLTSLDTTDEDLAGVRIDAHLMKPVRARLLRKTLEDVIRRARYANASGEDRRDIVTAPPSLPALPDAAKSRKPAQRTSGQSGLDVLVAEDNDVNRIVFTQILQQTGLRFRIVDNGKKALEAWKQDRPALILMDVSMPVMSGHQASLAIRELEKASPGDQRPVPIIAVTAHALEMDRGLCIAAGMNDYISKPISPDLLKAKIAHFLGDPLIGAMPQER